jgi:hypothetical protein
MECNVWVKIVRKKEEVEWRGYRDVTSPFFSSPYVISRRFYVLVHFIPEWATTNRTPPTMYKGTVKKTIQEKKGEGWYEWVRTVRKKQEMEWLEWWRRWGRRRRWCMEYNEWVKMVMKREEVEWRGYRNVMSPYFSSPYFSSPYVSSLYVISRRFYVPVRFTPEWVTTNRNPPTMYKGTVKKTIGEEGGGGGGVWMGEDSEKETEDGVIRMVKKMREKEEVVHRI